MIKTRFAPSPTGYLHVGGLRTALYCYLFARKNGGKFILRIEDTDREREVVGAVENLINTLEWVGLTYDEGPTKNGKDIGNLGPYTQSKRTETYRKYAQELTDKGHAYRCFCTKERLEEMRKRQEENHTAPMYDRKCLELPKSEIEANIASGTPFVIRQKMPYETIKFKDLIRGNIQFDGKIVDDQILMKSDGFPTYHLANVVDDHLMEITHVIRGEEWLPSTPKHIALYNSFGWNPPEFAHLPLLLNADKSKLSKRQGHVAVEEYIKEGYSKEAILNFVVFLGWNPGRGVFLTQNSSLASSAMRPSGGEENEIYTLNQLEKVFTLEKVHKAGAIFNLEKLDWFNWRWKKQNFLEKLAVLAEKIDKKEFPYEHGKLLYKECNKYLPEQYKLVGEEKLFRILVTVEEKILRSPKETEENIKFYFSLPDYNKELLTHEKMGVDLELASRSLEIALKTLEKLENWTENEIKTALAKAIEDNKLKTGQLLWPIRAALSGLQFSPGAFETAWALGKEETLSRIKIALEKLKS